MPNKPTNNWEKEFFELSQDCCVPHIIDDLPDDAWVNGWFEAFEKVKPFIAKTIQEAQIEGYAQGRLRCLQHHYPKELENVRQQERARLKDECLKQYGLA